MVKIPNLDDLRKIGADLVDSAKSGKLGSMVDKLKSGKDKSSEAPSGDAIQLALQKIYATLKELGDTQAAEAHLMKKVQDQISELAKTIESLQTSSASPDMTSTDVEEGKKP